MKKPAFLLVWVMTVTLGLFAQEPLGTSLTTQVTFPHGSMKPDHASEQAFKQALLAELHRCDRFELSTETDGSDKKEAYERLHYIAATITSVGVKQTMLRLDVIPKRGNAVAGTVEGEQVAPTVQIVKRRDWGGCGALGHSPYQINRKFNPTLETTFVVPESGSKITLPAQSLVYPDGSPVTGEVTLDYQEWRNPADIIRSGIPMHMPANGEGAYLNSGGMFEIRASQEGTPLLMAPGKQITVDFNLTSKDTFNFYQFRDGAWQQAGADQSVLPQSMPQPQSDKPCDETFRLPQKDTAFAFILAMRTAVSRLTKSNMIYYDQTLVAVHQFDQPDYLGQQKVTMNPSQKEISAHSVLSVAFKPIQDGYRIHIQDDSDKFYEVEAINRMPLLLKPKDYEKLRGQVEGKKFNDIKVDWPVGGKPKVILKGYKEYITLPFSVQAGGYGKASYYPSRETSMEAYDSYFRSRVNMDRATGEQIWCFSKAILPVRLRCLTYADFVDKCAKDPKEMRDYFQEALDQYQTDVAAIKQMIDKYLEERQPRIQSGSSVVSLENLVQFSINTKGLPPASAKITIKLTLDGFGIYNCDQLQRLPDPFEANPVFVDETGRKTNAFQTFVVFENINSVMRGDKGFAYLDATLPISALLIVDDQGKILKADIDAVREAAQNRVKKPTIAVDGQSSAFDYPLWLKSLKEN